MTSHSDLFACGGAIYIPRVNRALMEELDRHLREVRAAEASGEDVAAVVDGPRDASSVPSPTDLAGSLDLVAKAALLMGNVQRLLLRSRSECDDVERGLCGLTQQIADYEHTLVAVEEQLRCALEDAEAYRQRSLAAEQKLGLLVAAVTQNLVQPPTRARFAPYTSNEDAALPPSLEQMD